MHERSPLLRVFTGVAGYVAPTTPMPWVCTAEDELPTLDAIFKARATGACDMRSGGPPPRRVRPFSPDHCTTTRRPRRACQSTRA